ncbi:CCAPR-like protein, partial [Mya arenaria]
VPQLVVLVILFLMIVLGNTCVLVAIYMSEKGIKTRMHFFMMHLAVADLTVGLFNLTVDIVERWLVVWYGGAVLCKIIKFLQVLVVYSSTFMIVALSIDRADAIARPMKFTRKVVHYISSTDSINLTRTDNSFLLHNYHVCHLGNGPWLQRAAISTYIFQQMLNLIHLMFAGSSMPGNNKGIIPQAKIKTVKMTLIIVIVFVLCWCPYFVFNLKDVYSESVNNSKTYHALTSLIQSLAPLNSAANPIIYGVFGTGICTHL